MRGRKGVITMRKILSTFTVDFDSVCGEELEIVGNVYDNPELLERGNSI